MNDLRLKIKARQIRQGVEKKIYTHNLVNISENILKVDATMSLTLKPKDQRETLLVETTYG